MMRTVALLALLSASNAQPLAPCSGDFHSDGDVDVADVLTVLESFQVNSDGDTDGNGVTDTVDLLNVLSQFGEVCLATHGGSNAHGCTWIPSAARTNTTTCSPSQLDSNGLCRWDCRACPNSWDWHMKCQGGGTSCWTGHTASLFDCTSSQPLLWWDGAHHHGTHRAGAGISTGVAGFTSDLCLPYTGGERKYTVSVTGGADDGVIWELVNDAGFVEGTGGVGTVTTCPACPAGLATSLVLGDAGGDGWNCAQMSVTDCNNYTVASGITIPSAGVQRIDTTCDPLAGGSATSAVTVCLPVTTGGYTMSVSGGTKPYEISWSVLENGVVARTVPAAPRPTDMSTFDTLLPSSKPTYAGGWITSAGSGGKDLWTMYTGQWTSFGTGPNSAYGGSGQYFFLETSYPANNGDISYLTSPALPSGSPSITGVSFWYHMYGNTINRLRVLSRTASSAFTNTSFDETGASTAQMFTGAGSPWQTATISLPANTVQVQFEGTAGTSYTGDISIDSVELLFPSVYPTDYYQPAGATGCAGWRDCVSKFDNLCDASCTFKTFNITSPSVGGGSCGYASLRGSSAAAVGTWQIPCMGGDDNCTAVDCVGAWAPCDATCPGNNPFVISQPALGGGADCSFASTATRQCPHGTDQCVVRDCVGSFASCPASCGQVAYNITVPKLPAGKPLGADCPFITGETRHCDVRTGEGACPACSGLSDVSLKFLHSTYSGNIAWNITDSSGSHVCGGGYASERYPPYAADQTVNSCCLTDGATYTLSCGGGAASWGHTTMTVEGDEITCDTFAGNVGTAVFTASPPPPPPPPCPNSVASMAMTTVSRAQEAGWSIRPLVFPRPPPPPPAFSVSCDSHAGLAQQMLFSDGQCVGRSSASGYGNNERCTITPAGSFNLTAPLFNIETSGSTSGCPWDLLCIGGFAPAGARTCQGGTKYCGNTMQPSGTYTGAPIGVSVTPSTLIQWYSDVLIDWAPGWILCSAEGLAAQEASYQSTVTCESSGAADTYHYIQRSPTGAGASLEYADFYTYANNAVTPIADCCLTAGVEYEVDCFSSQSRGWQNGAFLAIEGTPLCSGGFSGSAHTETFRFNTGNVTSLGVHDVCGVVNGNGLSCRGCADPLANNIVTGPHIVPDNTLCTYRQGCVDTNAANYDPMAVFDDGSCDCGSGYRLTLTTDASSTWNDATIRVETCTGTQDGSKTALVSPIPISSGTANSGCVAAAPANNLTVTFDFPRDSYFTWHNITAAGQLSWSLTDSTGTSVLAGTGGDAVHQWSTCAGSCSGTDLTLHLSDSVGDGWDGTAWNAVDTSHLTVGSCPVPPGSPPPQPFTDAITLGAHGSNTSRSLCLSSGNYIFTYVSGNNADFMNHFWWVTNGPNQTATNAFINITTGTAQDFVIDMCPDCAGNAYPYNTETLNQCGVCSNTGMAHPFISSTVANVTSLDDLFDQEFSKNCKDGMHDDDEYGPSFDNLDEAKKACATDGRCKYVQDDNCQGNYFKMITSYAKCSTGGSSCVYTQKSNTTVASWLSSSCVGCMDSLAANFDASATIPGGCWPKVQESHPQPVVCNETISGVIMDATAGEAARHTYTFRAMPGAQYVFSTCGSHMYTRVSIADVNGTILKTSTDDIASGPGNHNGSCAAIYPGVFTRPSEIMWPLPGDAGMCTTQGGCMMHVVVSPEHITSNNAYYDGPYQLKMFCAGCSIANDPDQTAYNLDTTARFDTSPTMCQWLINTDCVGSFATCDSTCANVLYTQTVRRAGGGSQCPFDNNTAKVCAPGDGACPSAPNCSLSTISATHQSWDFRMTDALGNGWHGEEATIYDCNGTQLLPLPGLPPLSMMATAGTVADFESASSTYLRAASGAGFASLTGDDAGWTCVNGPGNGANYCPWYLNTGGTSSSSTGPSSGYGGSGKYFYLETSYQGGYSTGDETYLESPTFSSGTWFEMSFKYHIYGSSMGTLSVQVSNGTSWSNTNFIRDVTANENAWKSFSMQLASDVTQVRFVGTKGSSYTGDMAVDNVQFSAAPHVEDVCLPPSAGYTVSVGPVNSVANFESTAITTRVRSSSGAGFPGLTGFDAWTCVNGPTNTANYCPWFLNTGGTSSGSTGPSTDASGSGNYFYLETSYQGGYSTGDATYLESPTFSSGTWTKLSFKYHMYGSSMGTLSVQYSADNGTTWVQQGFSMTQNTQSWDSYTGTIPDTATQVRFSGTYMGSYTGDMAIDEVELFNDDISWQILTGSGGVAMEGGKGTVTTCGTCFGHHSFGNIGATLSVMDVLSADFETGMGGWTNQIHPESGDSPYDGWLFGWARSSRQTPSGGTGPTANTWNGNWYVYLETSSGTTGDVDYLYSPEIAGMHTLSFIYSMYGDSTMGTLAVDASSDESNHDTSVGAANWPTLWSRTGTQPGGASAWNTASISLPAGVTRVRISGTSNGIFRGDMAIDDLKLEGAAGTQPSTIQITACNGTVLGVVEAFQFGTPTTVCLSSTNGDMIITTVSGSTKWILNITDGNSTNIVQGAARVDLCPDCAGNYLPDNTATENECGVCQATAAVCAAMPPSAGVKYQSACANRFFSPYQLDVNGTHCCHNGLGPYFEFRGMSTSNNGWTAGTQALFTTCNGTEILGVPTVALPANLPTIVVGTSTYRYQVTHVCLPPNASSYMVSFPDGLTNNYPDYTSHVRWDLGPNTRLHTFGNSTCIDTTNHIDCAGAWGPCDCASTATYVAFPKQTYSRTVTASPGGQLCPASTGDQRSCNLGDSGCTAVAGCTDFTASNYNSLAHTDDGSCVATLSCFGARAAVNFSMSEDFESAPNAWTGWKSSTGGIGWTRDHSGTGSFATGPSVGAGGSAFYMYLETSGGSTSTPPTYLISPPVATHISYAQVSFSYHMYGATMGSLSVVTTTDATTSPTTAWTPTGWSTPGANADTWFPASVVMPEGTTFFAFKGEYGSSFQGDMAIDSVTITGQTYEIAYKTLCASTYGNYATPAAAFFACSTDVSCTGVYDQGCSGANNYTLCSSAPTATSAYISGSHCVHTAATSDLARHDSDLYISQITDPHGDPEARFWQIYNPTQFDIVMNTAAAPYTIKTYSNGNTQSSATISLQGTIASTGAYTLCKNTNKFNSAYANNPDVTFPCNRQSGSVNANGDDTIALYKNGVLIDIFGAIGLDGTGSHAEFEDGEALRIVPGPTRVYNSSEWSIRCDSSTECPDGAGGNTETVASDAALAAVPAALSYGFDTYAATKPTYADGWSSSAGSGGKDLWTMYTGQSTSFATGPNSAYGGSGQYFFLETSYPANNGDISYLTSPDLASISPPYMKFKYHMYGNTINRLRVLSRTASSAFTNTSFDETGASTAQMFTGAGSPWQTATISLPANTVQVQFEGTAGTSYTGDISIDSVEFGDAVWNAGCTDEGFVGFETTCGFDSWTGSSWARGSGSNGGNTTGPSSAAAGTWYQYLNTSGSSPSYTTSPSITANRWEHVEFDYHMYGSAMGSLSVDFYVPSIASTADFESKAVSAYQPVSSSSGVGFPGLTGSDAWTCVNGPGNGASNCPWYINTGGTSSGSTGPSSGYGGSGNYFYLETSYQAGYSTGDATYLESPTFSSGTWTKLSFKYHMYGSSMGTLTVQARIGTSWPTDPTASNAGFTASASTNAWQSGNATIPAGATQVRFVGTKGSSYTGDMAVDSVVLNGAARAWINAWSVSGSQSASKAVWNTTSIAIPDGASAMRIGGTTGMPAVDALRMYGKAISGFSAPPCPV
jgi:hypothetical protein